MAAAKTAMIPTTTVLNSTGADLFLPRDLLPRVFFRVSGIGLVFIDLVDGAGSELIDIINY
jgi:hypothetical protein